MFRALAALVMTTVLAAPGGAWAQAQAQERAQERAEQQAAFTPPNGFRELAAANLPAVASVIATQEVATAGQGEDFALPPGLEEFFERFGEEFLDRFRDGRPRRMPEEALGSGFVIDPEGYIVTNNHVLEGAEEIEVVLEDGPRLAAEVVGADPQTDLALLRVDPPEPLPSLSWGDSDEALIGDWVMAIGNPFGLGGSVTTGVVSARARDIQAGPYDDFIQTDAAINQGNSGGPLIDMQGRVVGVNTAIFSPTGGSVGIGFAVPSRIAQPIIEELRETGTVRRGWLGVQIQPVNEEVAQALGLDEPRGALVSDVVEGAPADEAGVQIGDVIVGFAGTEIEEVRDLTRAVAAAPVGEVAELTVLRDGERTVLRPEIALLEPEPEQAAAAVPEPEAGPLGMTVAPLTPERRARYGIDEGVTGVVVTGVAEGGAAFRGGIMEGDVILRVGGQEVSTQSEFSQAVDRAREAGRRTVLVLRQREEEQLFVALPIEQQEG